MRYFLQRQNTLASTGSDHDPKSSKANGGKSKVRSLSGSGSGGGSGGINCNTNKSSDSGRGSGAGSSHGGVADSPISSPDVTGKVALKLAFSCDFPLFQARNPAARKFEIATL